MQNLFADFVCLPTHTKRGNVAILVVLDSFSKFVIFYPVRRFAASVVIDCFERSYFPAYGAPNSIVTDNANVFRSKQVKDLCFCWGVEHIFTTSYYTQSSLAKRVNRNLKSALKVYHHQAQNSWYENLPFLAFAFKTALHDSTQTTFDLLCLGREIKSPLGSRWDLPSLEVDARSAASQSLWARACKNLRSASCKVACRFNEGRKPHQFRVGDTVMYTKSLVSNKALMSLPKC